MMKKITDYLDIGIQHLIEKRKIIYSIHSKEFKQRLLILYSKWVKETGEIEYPPFIDFINKNYPLRNDNTRLIYNLRSEIVDIQMTGATLSQTLKELKVSNYENKSQILEIIEKATNKIYNWFACTYLLMGSTPASLEKKKDRLEYTKVYLLNELAKPTINSNSSFARENPIVHQHQWDRCIRYINELEALIIEVVQLLKNLAETSIFVSTVSVEK